MVSLCDLPPFVIDQVIGTRDTSYVVIKLWLCGNRQLHSKLSTGLTFLELQGHPLGTFCFPKLIKHLQSLRMFSIFCSGPLIRTGESPTSLIESLPPTLERLELFDDDAPKLIWNHGIVTQYPRGPSESIDLETLFPRLRTLILCSEIQFITSDVFPALPSSLVDLYMRVRLSSSDTVLMSALPPNLQKMPMRITWVFDGADENASFEAIRHNFSSAPPSLQTMKLAPYGLPWGTQKHIETCSYEFMLPKSLLEVDYGTDSDGPFWCPSLARSMPSMLQSLSLCNINASSFRDTNWIAELPLSLTNLAIRRTRPDLRTQLPFTPYVRFLPPGLIELSLHSYNHQEDEFGDWSTISKTDWPSTLQLLLVSGIMLKPHELSAIPTTLQTLVIEIDTMSVSNDDLKVELPSGLTDLSLIWNTPNIDFAASLAQLPLKKCTLTYGSSSLARIFDWHKIFPSTLESLTLDSVALVTLPNNDTIVNLPRLASFSVYSLNYRWFKFLPRSLRSLKVELLETHDSDEYELDESENESLGQLEEQLFTHLPPSLTELAVEDVPFYESDLQPQDLEHLQSLTSLQVDTFVSSKQLRKLPRSLKHLKLSFEHLDLDDLQYLPDRLESFMDTDSTDMIDRLPLACLAQMEFESEESEEFACNRVLHASKHP